MRALLLAVLLTGCATAPKTYDMTLLEMGAAYTAKETCSCLFVMGRPLDWCREWTRVRRGLITVRVDEEARSVTARALGQARTTAQFLDPRLGCVLTTPPPGEPLLPSAAMSDPTQAPADVAAAPADAQTTASGLAWKTLSAGSGDRPTSAASVTVHYSGWTTDGELFDSSRMRGQAATFPLDRVIKGWTEGLQLMQLGESTRFWIPAELAYGHNPGGGRPGGMLCFDVELLSFVEPPPPPKVPEDVAGIPSNADVTSSGLGHRVLKAGTGTERPKATSTVTVHYSGWTLDGRMFDSSVVRGETISFPLNRVIAGWTEGLQLMVVGEKRRFWIPAEAAYGHNPGGGRPGGMLVFDVELFSFQ